MPNDADSVSRPQDGWAASQGIPQESSAGASGAPRIRINIDKLHIALVWRDPGSAYYLDLSTGDIFLHEYGCDPDKDSEMRCPSGRYHHIQPIDPRHSYQAVADFVEFLPSGPVRDQLRQTILGKGAFRRFKEFIATHPTEKELWLIFKEQREMSYVDQWLATLPFAHEPYDPYSERRKARLKTLENVQTRGIRVRRVDHVCLRVPDLEAARAFYEDVLQLAPVAPPARPPGGTATLWFRCGNLDLCLEHSAEGCCTAECAPALTFEVACLAHAQQALESAGIRTRLDGTPGAESRLHLADPGGNRIELREAPAAVERQA